MFEGVNLAEDVTQNRKIGSHLRVRSVASDATLVPNSTRCDRLSHDTAAAHGLGRFSDGLVAAKPLRFSTGLA